MNPKAKIGMCLKLRQMSAYMSVAIIDSMIVRINLVSTTIARRDEGVRSWVNNVVNSGWCHQLWPTRRGYRLNYDGERGIPRGMKQAYFDKANGEKRVLGWKKEYEDGSTKWTLVL